jgi:hypothetical protein
MPSAYESMPNQSFHFCFLYYEHSDYRITAAITCWMYRWLATGRITWLWIGPEDVVLSLEVRGAADDRWKKGGVTSWYNGSGMEMTYIAPCWTNSVCNAPSLRVDITHPSSLHQKHTVVTLMLPTLGTLVFSHYKLFLLSCFFNSHNVSSY